ncbi:hypothetical protein HNP82_000995 [Catenibacillus scindens]|uniref:Uncharacterized protein n=2 Tax=Catenibacillus scindens TaxID=673271 RepID=A0A7W8M4D9_9FIRM|nr:hypothetical protein [Catenibacillus scindens]MBB5263890.1 hypothetical protein [Catenibacillus scindens]
MARKRKRDFWDDVEDDVISQEESERESYSAREQGGYTEDYEDEGFRLTRCMPAKIIARILLCAAAVVIVVCGLIFYRYVDDRQANGTYTTSYFDSNGFSREYNDAVERLLEALQAIEAEGNITTERAAELASGIMGTNTNFSYYIMDEAGNVIVESGDDARDRIEASNHFMRIANISGELEVESGVPTTGLNRNAWQTALDECTNAYQIYTAVDNNLEREDTFYESYIDYQNLTEYFGIAKIVGIVAIVVFLVLLIFCVIATGMNRGYAGVRLTWFDRIFTEIALIIILAIIGALVYGQFYLGSHEVRFSTWLRVGDGFLIYVFLIRGYFSLVRRIKSGTFITNSIIYKICHAINMALDHLPKALKIIIILVFLVALNGAMVYGLLYMRDITAGSIPVIFIVAPVVFVIELIGFINCIFGVGDEEDYIEDSEENEEDEEAGSASADDRDDTGWENVDFGSEIRMAEEESYEDHSDTGATVENVRGKAVDKTVVLSQNERRKVLDSLGFGETQMLDTKAVREAEQASLSKSSQSRTSQSKASQSKNGPAIPDIDQMDRPGDKTVIMEPLKITLDEEQEEKPSPVFENVSQKTQPVISLQPQAQPEATGLELVDFIQLNKDVRKMFRMKLKARSIGVTLRAPEKPIYLDIDKANAIRVLSILFDNIEKYAEEGSRVYIEMYAQNGKMIYLMKNTIRADLINQTTNAMGHGLMEARRIVQSEKGKFINSVEGNTYKVGILLDVASE